jgi:hypothetical protein
MIYKNHKNLTLNSPYIVTLETIFYKEKVDYFISQVLEDECAKFNKEIMEK